MLEIKFWSLNFNTVKGPTVAAAELLRLGTLNAEPGRAHELRQVATKNGGNLPYYYICIFMRTKAATHLCAFVLVAAHWSLLAADDPEERGLPQDVGIGEWRARVLEAAARRVSELEATIRARDSEIAVLRAGGARAHVSSPVQALPEAGVSKKQPAGRPPSLPLSLPLSLARSLPPSLFRGVVPVYLFILRQCGYVYRSTAPLDTPLSSRLDVHPSTAPAAPSRCHSDSLTPIPPFSPSLSRVCLRAALVNCYDGCQDAQGDGAWVPQLL